MSSPIVILAGARTPIGKLSGSLASFSAVELGGFAITAALERAGLTGDQIDYVYMGHVLQAGAGQITARQAAVHGGIPMTVPATTVNKVCLSGMDAIYQADRRIRSGDAEIVVAGGMESMTNAPHLLPGARAGYRIGDGTIVDSMMYDGLYCAFDQFAMGEGTEKYAQAHGLVREHMDAMAVESHRRADVAQQEGRFEDEIVPVTVPQRRGDAVIVGHDEGVRGETTIESLAGLRPAFDKAGHITAGNASQISDGASAIIITTAEVARPARGNPARRDRRLRPGRRPRRLAAPPALPGHQGRARPRRPDRLGPRSVRDQRGVRRGRRRLRRRPGDLDGRRERQRRRHRHGPPPRHVRQPHRPAPRPRARPPRRRHRRSGAVRRRRAR